jgi:DNA-binding PucR family transcriptional regulator
VHKHTLSYRLGRIEDITGRDLSRMSDLVPLWLAVQAYKIVADRPATPPSR